MFGGHLFPAGIATENWSDWVFAVPFYWQDLHNFLFVTFGPAARETL
jgi:hypothetical protein